MRSPSAVWASVFLGAVCVLLVVVAWLGWENLWRPAAIVVSPSDEAVTLADAIDLLPHPENAVAGRAIGGGRYWVWVETIEPPKTPLEESWIVDTSSGDAAQVSARRFGPAGGQASVSYLDNASSAEYLSVQWSGGYEGVWTNVNEYYRRDTGALAYSLVVNSGQNAQIVASGRTVDIAYAPATLCDSVSFERNTATEQATGLIIDGTTYAFPRPMDVACGYSDFSGETLRENFGSFFVDGDHARLIFPHGHADIPLSLDMAGLEFDLY